MFKTCLKCGIEYPLTSEYWHKKHTSKDGFNSRCKKCANEDDRKNYHANNGYERKKKNQKEYYRGNREKIIKYKKAYRASNKELIKETGKKYYQKNKIRIKNYRKEFLSTKHGKNYKKQYDQKRRYKIQSIPCDFTEEQWKECKAYFDNKCAYCGEIAELTRDHFIPLKQGGEYTKNNIIPACKSCNCSKRTQDYFEWYPKQIFYSKARETKILQYLNYNNSIQQLALTI